MNASTNGQTPEDRTHKYCVLGAGSSGLAVAKNLLQAGIPFDCLEREDDVGGNWYYGKPHSSVYRSTRLISSKQLTEYTDFPMPAEWPEYPGQREAGEYLRSYARHFDLDRTIEFNTTVERLDPQGDEWLVTLGDGRKRRYRGVIIANGHNWDPKRPNYPGTFDGLTLHSAEYKTPDLLKGRRVLVVGAGNSGCDIAVESALNAEQTFHSLRRGYHFLPKFIRGLPADQLGETMLRWRLPLWLRRVVAGVMRRYIFGPPEAYGLPRPDHRLFESHPIINSQLPYFVGHGMVKIKPDVAELCGREVRFVDGTREPVDVIVYATGFHISFPFIDRECLNWSRGRPELYLNVFHPERDNLFVVGLIQPDSGQWGLVDYQGQLIARFLRSLADGDTRQVERFRRLKSRPWRQRHAAKYLDSPRHLLEVEHYGYRRELQREIAKFGALTPSPSGRGPG